MQTCMNDMWAIYAWMNECMSMYETFVTTRLWDYWDKVGQVQEEVAWYRRTKHSAVFNGDNITGD